MMNSKCSIDSQTEKSVLNENCIQSAPTLRSEVDHHTVSGSGIFENVCLFCNQFQKKINNKRETLGQINQQQSENTIKQAALGLNDENLLAKISGIDLIAKKAKLHHSCRSAYLRRHERSKNRKNETYDLDAVHIRAYDSLRQFVQTEVIDCGRLAKLLTLFDRYISFPGNSNPPYKPQYICEKLLSDFTGKLKTCKSSKKEGIILCTASRCDEDVLHQTKYGDNFVTGAAMFLRNAILSQNVENLPDPITADIVKQGQDGIPEELVSFFRILYTGSKEGTRTDQTERLIKSVSDDVVFGVSHGKIKPGKHLSLGMSLKSLTGSRKVLEILNRLGHCVSYHKVEEIETQLATDISNKDQATPDGLSKSPGLLTSLAWDNYDENLETLSGAGTLHDTVGICYQAVQPDDVTENVSADSVDTQNIHYVPKSIQRPRRSLEISEKSIEPYRKKPRMSKFEYQRNEYEVPNNFHRIQKLDLFWMMNISVRNDVPLWAGWNSQVTIDELPIQRIGYMENLNLPPTRLDVVVETLKQSLKVAKECKEDFVIVTYDLAVAKPALQIQAQETPLYDNVFICFGAFHILLAYFGSLGYFLDGSGGPEILTDSQVLAAGSLNSFLKGKQYNRCKRLHTIPASAFSILHFRQFMETFETIPGELLTSMKLLSDHPSPELLEEIETSKCYDDYITEYQKFCEKTKDGHHGSTAKFWIIYTELVNVFLRFTRACRTNDLDLFIHSLNEMCSMFFATCRPNYSRWMVKYYMNLVNANPRVRERLEKGALSVRRTKKNFSRCEVDLTLEQTINADAASRLTGISAFTNSVGAKRRWMLTRAVRGEVVGGLLEKVGLKSEEDITKSLKSYRIKKDQDDLQQVVECIETTMDPFKLPPHESLYCLTTGKESSTQVKHDLLHSIELGTLWKEDFKGRCIDDPNNFEKPLKRRKIKNFISDAVKTKVTFKDKKVLELQSTRDLFGRLLCLSTEENIDLEKVFSYPLIAVPLSLAQVDGSVKKTDKSKFMHRLEQRCAGPQPENVDVTLADAMFFLHTLQNVPKTFGQLSTRILTHLTNMSKRADFVCDVYKTPSIKNTERDRRGECETAYCITGPEQKLPSDWQKSLRNVLFKRSLFNFLAEDWMDNRHAHLLEKKEVYLGVEQTCHSYTGQRGMTMHDIATQYNCGHEEADTRLLLHLHRATDTKPNDNYVIRSNDTDVLVLLMYHAYQLEAETRIWMDAGLSSRNNRRFIPLNNIKLSANQSLVNAIPGFHAFTGCDFTAAFANKGKARPFDVMQKNETFITAFAKLGETFPVSEQVSDVIKAFVCSMYGYPKTTCVNKARYNMFKRVYAVANLGEVSTKTKGIDPSCMPPCKKVLQKKIHRANYLTALWKNADKACPLTNLPEENGWSLANECDYSVLWFDGDQLPTEIIDLLVSSSVVSKITQDEDDTVGVGESDSDSDEEEL